ncbi:hypothetical protein HUT06_14530 [Actinomadura sp. NAK00032]|uniref:hypothetical protein n=1 Tax=Actinomadura sp. NAK00032 TaxID=2742128 RepID=UPI001591718D|nr:hypothetical protein [Actinomadura sp. NAK00032]QKW35097.1 hypothetical protein HUT06_14530 [Actinomadura sp. NAK00032]
MKFELIEFAAADDVRERAADQLEEEAGRHPETDVDPVAAIGAAVAALTAGVRAEGLRIEASVAELAAVREPAPRRPWARPPADFRPGRFSKGDAR